MRGARQLTYLVLLLEVGHHDDGGRVQLPNHAPEVRESGRNWTLGGYVPVGTLVSLDHRNQWIVNYHLPACIVET